MSDCITVDGAREAVEKIKQIAEDDESAHGAEDGLRSRVLEAIASGALRGKAAREAAQIALSTDDIDFARWCA